MCEEERTRESEIMEALVKAKEAFKEYLETLNIEPARFDIRFTVWLVDTNFETRLQRIELEEEVKEK